VCITPKKPVICVIGCGWLGYPLAKRLISEEFTVFGTTTSPEKLDLLRESNIKPTLYSVGHDKHLPEADVYVVNIPPSGVSDYTVALQKLIRSLPITSRLIFCSSTSVYRDVSDLRCLEEDVSPGHLPNDPDLDVARHGTPRRTLIQAEGIIAEHPNYLILRLAGLYGGTRHPVKYLSGRKHLSSPNALVNLIHLEDLIETGLKVIRNPPDFNVMNVCSGEHPSRIEYYTQQAVTLGLPLPEFNSENTSTGKIIDNSRLVNFLGYNPPLR
jgi:nucleoside-diphosphate-sugar epimerase